MNLCLTHSHGRLLWEARSNFLRDDVFNILFPCILKARTWTPYAQVSVLSCVTLLFWCVTYIMRYKRRRRSWLSVFHCFTMKHGHTFKQNTSTSRFAKTALSRFYRMLCSRLCSMFPPKRSPHGHEHTQRKCRAVITDAPLQVQEARGGILINIIRNE